LKQKNKTGIIIKDIDAAIVKFPIQKKSPLGNGKYLEHVTCLIITVYTQEGLEGFGYTHGFGEEGGKLLALIQHHIIPAAVGQDTRTVTALLLAQSFANPQTLANFAISAIDIACWDITAKSHHLPLIQLLEYKQPSLQVYGSGGWLGFSHDELLQECKWYYDRGVKAYKFKIGGPQDAERINLLRNSMPADCILMVDANEKSDLTRICAILPILQQNNIIWIEEPLPRDAIDGMAMLAKQISIPIAAGENLYYMDQFSNLCRKKAAYFIQPDIGRCGGITQFLEIAKLVQNAGLALCSHLMMEISASVLPACMAGKWLEHMILFPEEIFVYPFELKQGQYVSSNPAAVGTGVYFTKEALAKYKIL